MSDGGIAGQRSIDRRTVGRAAGAIGVMVILAAILGPAALTTRPTATSPSATQVAAVPTSSNGAGPTTTPTEEPQAWDDLDVPAFELAAAFEPNDRDRLGVAANSTFTVRSLTSTPAVELAKGLRIDPPTAFTVTPGSSPDQAIVKPSTALVEGLRYRFRLDAPDGALAGAWSFTTRAPLHVVSTLPGDRTTEVPTNTGIEVEFDQDGTKGIADHFSIAPAAPGRFEQHGRRWAFVPNRALASATIYTITVRAGVGLIDSAETLESDVTFRFETAAAATPGVSRLAFGRSMFESRPGERVVLPMGYAQAGDVIERGPDSVTVDIHRLSGFGAVLDAAIALAGPNSWAVSSPSAVVDTSDLTRVARVDGKLLDSDHGLLLRLPFEPSAGGYILTVVQPGPPQQMLLQVTNLAAYALTAETNTVVWVNDLATHGGVANVAVSLARGASLGSTNTSGVLRAATPTSLTGGGSTANRGQPGFLTIRAPDGRRLVLPLGLPLWSWEGGYDGGYEGGDDSANWWLMLRTDRNAFRQTDTVNVYGMIRARSDRSVPDGIELRLRPSEGRPEAPILRLRVRPTERGVFNGALRLDDLPRGAYMIDLYVGVKRISSVWISVTEIRKPPFRIDVETDRHVYVLGQPVAISAVTSFYDGTAVPGMDLRFSGFEKTANSRSGAAGDAAATLKAASSYAPEGWLTDSVGVAPAHPEEGQIDGTANVVLVPARVWVTGDGTISGGRVVVKGTLTWTDIKGMEATLDAGGQLDYDGDGPGRPIAAGKIRAEVIHVVPVKKQVGTQYDFIEKRVVPVYEYNTSEVSLGTSTLTSTSDGTFRLSVPAPVATDDYMIHLSSADPEGRRFIRTVYASPPVQSNASRQPYLNSRSIACGYDPGTEVGLNKPFTVSMHEGTGKVATGGRFLFLVAERGSLDATLQDAATFSRTLRDADLPGFTVRAVWLSESGYAVADAQAFVDPDTKRVTIALVPNRSRYQPGQHATIAVTTRDRAGHPVAADVIVQGVDEKLYTQGLAADVDPVPDLMQRTSPGFLQSYISHDVPWLDEGGCGGAGGGGRDDFRDVITFQRITTGPDGRGSVDFDLADDLTSWHVTATAVSAKLDSGIASVQLPVGLPFFVDAVLAPEYLVGEQPVLLVRAYGGALVAGTPVSFVVEAPSLGLGPTTVKGVAFKPVRVPLPKLVAGDHRIRIAGHASRSGKAYDDALIRTVHVASSRLTGLSASYDLLGEGFSPQGGDGLTTYAITDAGRGRLLSLLQDLAWAGSGRFDRLAAAAVARRVLVEEFGFSPANLPTIDFDSSRYQHEGIALLPYSSTDLFLSARAALSVPNMLDRGSLVAALRTWADEEQATRERRIVALAGLAGLGEDVSAELRAYDASSLTVRERLWLALGLAASGDEAAARQIERDLLESAGQRLGPWVRLTTGTTLDDSLEASGLLLLLAGRLGDPIANEVSRYLSEVPSRERVFSLEQIGYATGMLDRLSRDPGRFAWTVAGERHEVQLPPGGGYTLVLTSTQRATLRLERLKGELAVVTTWTSSDVQLPTSSSISVQRTVTPGSDAPDDRLVHVRITVTFGPQSAPGCYSLVDLTPSGLSAVTATAGWPGDADAEGPVLVNGPYSIDAQRVSWCAAPSDLSHVYQYAARVVSPGSYRWEPAVLQFELAPGVGASTAESAYTIR